MRRISPLTLPEGTVDIQRTVTDGDDDSASDAVDISEIFKFEDDGPDVPTGGRMGSTLSPTTPTFRPQRRGRPIDMFPQAPDFGNDGPNASHAARLQPASLSGPRIAPDADWSTPKPARRSGWSR